jgi:hypothetical protein
VTRLRRNQRGSSIVEFGILAPVFFGVVGLAMFTAHIYEVRSDLERAAQRTAVYGAVRCDPRGSYGAGSGCVPSGNGHHNDSEMLTYAKTQFDNGDFVDSSSCSLADGDAVYCRTYSPDPPSGPVANQRVTVRLKYRYDTPAAPFLRLLGLGSTLVDLDGRGEATVE